MKLTNGILLNVIKELNELYLYSHVSNIFMINSKELIFSFSKNRKDYLFVSLNENDPYIYHSCEIEKIDTTINKTIETLRKELSNGFLNKIEMINNDRIISFEFKKRDDYYNEIKRTLIIELIPTKTNILIVDENNIILYTNKVKDISSNRPLIKGIKYIPLNNDNNSLFNDDYSQYTNQVLARYLSSIERRKEEKFKPFLTKIKGRLKKNERREILLKEDYNKSKNNLYLIDVGNMILTLQNEMDQLNEYLLDISYKDYDYSISPIKNAEKVFQLYKKAKSKIYHDEIELEKIKEENLKIKNIIDSFYYLNEDDLYDINNEFHLINNKNSKKEKHKNKINYIEYKNHKIYFGKSDKQNENLTFSFANKDDIFLHIDGYHGAHILIKDNDLNDDTLLFAGKIALLLSNKKEGDINYTKIKNVKRGDKKGLVYLKERKTIHINKIEDSIKNILISNQKSI